MMFLGNFKLLITIIIINSIAAQLNFPERFEIDKTKSNLAGRLPLYAPSRCKHDELLYPGDQKDDWICDCAPAAIYHPDSDECFPAFRQGPCDAGQFLILAVNSIIPQCISNSCGRDGQIRIHNKCYTFGESPPCRNAELSYVLGVDPNTMLVDCVKLSVSVSTRFSETERNATNYNWNEINPCPPGSKRIQSGKCVRDKQTKEK